MVLGMAQKMSKWRGLPQGTIRGYSDSTELVALIGRMLHPDHHARPSAEEIKAECTSAKCKLSLLLKPVMIFD